MPLPNEDAERQARQRALASVIVDAPRPAERFAIPPEGTHRASQRQRSVPLVKRIWQTCWGEYLGTGRRRIALTLLVLQCAAVIALTFMPQFQIRHIDVVGTEYLTKQDILDAAQVPRSSIFTLNPASIQSRLNSAPWIESSKVETSFPSTVVITIHEWPTNLRLVRNGEDYLVSSQGQIIKAPPQAWVAYSSKPLVIDDRNIFAQTISGESLFNDSKLVNFMNTATASFPTLLGTNVVAFEWASDGVLSIWTSSGFQVVIGDMDTEAALSLLPEQMTDLVALKTQLDFQDPTFGYVNLENVGEVAVGGTPGLTSAIQQAISGAAVPKTAPATHVRPTPTRSPAPRVTARPAPTAKASPVPTATPYYVPIP